MLSMFPGMKEAVSDFKDHLQQQNALSDPKLLPHVGSILSQANKITAIDDISHLSSLNKLTKSTAAHPAPTTAEIPMPLVQVPSQIRQCILNKFAAQHEQLKWAGVDLSKEEVYLIDKHLVMIAEQNQA